MMKLVQKILSHGLLIAFVVAAFFLYTKRAELFPQWFAKAQAPVAVAANEAPAKDVTRPKPEKVISKQPVAPLGQPAPAAHDEAAPEAGADGGAGADKTPQAQPEASAPATPEAPTDAGVRAQSDQVPAAMPEEQAAADSDMQTPSEIPTTAVEATAPAAVAETPEATTPAGNATPQASADDEALLVQQLAQARSLYWSKDTRGAELIYQSLSQAHPENPDVWGEAGNFYYSLQRREQAADAYARAFDLLMRQGQQERAGQLLGVMHQLDEEKARVLEMKLQQPEG
jgi:hypothetical protein